MYSCSNLSNLCYIKIFLPESVYIKMLLEWRFVEVSVCLLVVPWYWIELQPFSCKLSLRHFNLQVEWQIQFQITAESSLTEPYVAHVMSKALSPESALFLGNSMPIRDVDMYGHSGPIRGHSVASLMLNSDLPLTLMRVAANRGASGIDGLLSTAIGFAVGCNKKVTTYNFVSTHFTYVSCCLL